MRFLADGPSIPDELLLARDQGRVVFFCGAGVSRAKAKLPSFFGLAEKVISTLGVSRDSPAYKLVREAQEIDQRVGVAGVISADRVFGLLERQFLSRDIESAVALALKPLENCDLSAHKTLLDLATTPEGSVRIVTTNFDRLFDSCRADLQTWQPPRLPDPLRSAEMNGIIYLHGKTSVAYDGAEGDGFVLSSSEFGRAYLSDGWATSFVRDMIERYVVAFVGYTADDPPVQYLLEALNKKSGKLGGVYAFQAGGQDDASARWRHKGVEAIAYAPERSHAALWDTLEAWAVRAKDSKRWETEIVNLARQGPSTLQPHERGQIAHLIKTYEGAKRFTGDDEPPPAEWLCVFDPYRRYAKPMQTAHGSGLNEYIDPFDLYGLDSDVVPKKIEPDDYSNREVPRDSWNAFALNRFDRNELADENISALSSSSQMPQLVPRLRQLGDWISQVSNQPAAVWWAAHQNHLHKSIRDQIGWELERTSRTAKPEIRQAWRYLFESWENQGHGFHRDIFLLKASIAKDGWNSLTARQYAAIRLPHLTVKANFWGGPRPPESTQNPKLGDLVQLSVQYADNSQKTDIPAEWLPAIVQSLKRNLEVAVLLEKEIGGYGLMNISPIADDSTVEGDGYERTHGISAEVIMYANIFSRLVEIDRKAAYREFSAWSFQDEVFARLRIWASGIADLVQSDDFENVARSLTDKSFWDSGHQRDLLLSLAKRWNDLSESARQFLEGRLLGGPPKRSEENEAEFKERSAWSVLTRINWLAASGCRFAFDLVDLETITKSLRQKAPEWKPEYAERAAESLESRVGSVETITDYAPLVNIPLSLVLSRAKDLSGRTTGRFETRDPFAGLCKSHPIRAFTALVTAAKSGGFPEWAWEAFLDSEARKDDKPRLVCLIGKRLISYPAPAISSLIRPICDWLSKTSGTLAKSSPPIFDGMIKSLVAALRAEPEKGRSSIVRGNKEPDWTMEAINSPVGKIARILLEDPRKDNLKAGEGFPLTWLHHLEQLLNFPSDMRRHALVILFHNLNWFYAIDPRWVEKNLLTVFSSSEKNDRDAAWAGFFWGAKVPNPQLYMHLKAGLLDFVVKKQSLHRKYTNVSAGIILGGWGNFIRSGERCISNGEMRELLLQVDDDFRSKVLWQAERWSIEAVTKEKWRDLVTEFLRDVWPRQISAKSPQISGRLFNLAFSDKERFLERAEIILPLLTKFSRGDHLALPNLRNENTIVDSYPKQTLGLLDAVLPDRATEWPYGIEEIIQRVGDADKHLSTDERLIGLRRRWDAR